MEEVRKDNVGEERDLSLGKKIGISDHYDPGILRAVPRIDNRKNIPGLMEGAMPFHGFDVWNCYEFSYLNGTGVPQNYCLKIMYNCTSECIVESKSLKLYLGSFAQESYEGSIEDVVKVIVSDLEALLNTKVDVEWYKSSNVNWCPDSVYLDEVAGSVTCTEFERNPDLLETFKSNKSVERIKVYSDSLRSNCRVTHQPDEGDIYIEMEGPKVPTYSSLLKYIVSFRKEYHFHEEIIETIFADLTMKFAPTKLIVAATYLRRGGISICPVRFNRMDLMYKSNTIRAAVESFRFASRRD